MILLEKQGTLIHTLGFRIPSIICVRQCAQKFARSIWNLKPWNLFYWLKVLVDYGGMRLSPTYIAKLNYVYMQDNFVDIHTLALVLEYHRTISIISERFGKSTCTETD